MKIFKRATLAAAAVSFAAFGVPGLFFFVKACCLGFADNSEEDFMIRGAIFGVAVPAAIFGAYFVVRWVVTGVLTVSDSSQQDAGTVGHASASPALQGKRHQ